VGQRMLWFFTVFYPVMASIRLARYNVEHSTEASPYFRGLPSPGAAAVVCAWIILYHQCQVTLSSWHLVKNQPYSGLVNLDPYGWSLLAITTLAALLMVSTIRYPHIGNTLLGRISFRKMILGILIASLFVVKPPETLFCATTGYMLWGLMLGIRDSYVAWKRGRDPLDDEEDAEAEDAGLGAAKDPDTGPAHGR
jgi:CDP-diacylglycerol--serine O-phosphatidyltransferase